MGEKSLDSTFSNIFEIYFSFLITLFLALVFFLNHVELQIAPVGYNDYPIILIFLLTSLVVLAYTIMQMIGFEFFDQNKRLPLWFRKFSNWIHRLFNRSDLTFFGPSITNQGKPQNLTRSISCYKNESIEDRLCQLDRNRCGQIKFYPWPKLMNHWQFTKIYPNWKKIA